MRLGLLVGAFVALAGFPAAAQQGGGPGGDPRLDDIEEQVLRTQVETYLNEFAHWDTKQHRIVIDRRGEGKGKGELGGMEPIAEMLLGRTVKPGENGQLRIREELKLRPFAKVAQDFIAEGGSEDIEAYQRFRRGEGESPFKKGIPPRVQKAITGLLRALNDQPSAPQLKNPDDDGDDDDDRDQDRDRDRKRDRDRDRPPSDSRLRSLRMRIAERLDLDPEELDQLERYARELADQLQGDVERFRKELRGRVDEFSKSERGEALRDRAARLRRRAEDELRRALESEDVKKQLEDAQRRAMEFLASPEGQEMQRRIMEFLDSDNGREIRRRLDQFLNSEQGKDLLRRLSERFLGKRPRPKGGEDDQRYRGEEEERLKERILKDEEQHRKIREAEDGAQKGDRSGRRRDREDRKRAREAF